MTGICLYASVMVNRLHFCTIFKKQPLIIPNMSKDGMTLLTAVNAAIIKWHAAKRAHQNVYWIKA